MRAASIFIGGHPFPMSAGQFYRTTSSANNFAIVVVYFISFSVELTKDALSHVSRVFRLWLAGTRAKMEIMATNVICGGGVRV